VSYLKLIECELGQFEIDLREPQKLMLAAYCEQLASWNRKMNLTGLSDTTLVRRLVAEPVWIASALQLRGALIDIGSGNGSPAVPFDIVCGFERCQLVESRTKRAAFLRHLAMVLPLPKVIVHRSRFEEVLSDLEPASWISLRAVFLNARLMDSIRQVALPKATIVWITSRSVEAATSLNPFRTLTVPITGTRVLLFQLDLL
jgi:16S rRNA (guanine(527)-N(7))-methyltransferase RsmG